MPQHASEPFLPPALSKNSSLISATKPASKPVLAKVYALILGDLLNGAVGNTDSVLCGNVWDDWAEVSRLSRHSLVRRRKVIVVATVQ